MKRIIALFSILIVICALPAAGAETEPVPEVQAQSVVMLNTNTGAVVYEKNADARIFPASTTKILTMILAIEHCKDISEIVTVSDTFNKDLIVGGTSISLKTGEQITVEDLLYATAVASANDAANVLAEYTAGSIEAFVQMMNDKAAELGAQGTHFTNTHGLPDDDHYTTAADMMLFMRYALKNELFRTLNSTYAHTIPATNMTEKRTVSTTNSLISSVSENYYRYARGGKTGTTTAAGYNLISWATRNDMDFILVAMHAEKKDGSSNPIFSDSRKLYTWAFDNFSEQRIVESNAPFKEVAVSLSAEKDYVMLCARENLSAILPKDLDPQKLEYKTESADELMAPIVKGEVYGALTVSMDGVVYGKTDLIAAEDVSRSTVLYYLYCIRRFLQNIWVQIIGGLLLVLIVIYIIIMVRNNRNRRRRQVRFKSRLKY